MAQKFFRIGQFCIASFEIVVVVVSSRNDGQSFVVRDDIVYDYRCSFVRIAVYIVSVFFHVGMVGNCVKELLHNLTQGKSI